MRASPRISVLGEVSNPCIAGNGPSEDHKTMIFPGDGFPFSLTIADMHDLDNGASFARKWLSFICCNPVTVVKKNKS